MVMFSVRIHDGYTKYLRDMIDSVAENQKTVEKPRFPVGKRGIGVEILMPYRSTNRPRLTFLNLAASPFLAISRMMLA